MEPTSVKDKIIYVVTSGDYSDYGIEGVFSSEAQADKYIGKVCPRGVVEEWTLDRWIDKIDQGLTCWAVSMDRDGDNAEARKDEPVTEGRESSRDGFYYSYKTGKVDQWNAYYIWARDEKHAIKIANEKRTHHIATAQER